MGLGPLHESPFRLKRTSFLCSESVWALVFHAWSCRIFLFFLPSIMYYFYSLVGFPLSRCKTHFQAQEFSQILFSVRVVGGVGSDGGKRVVPTCHLKEATTRSRMQK